MKPKRPTSVTVLAAGVFFVTALGWTRFFQTLQIWDFLQTLPTVVPPEYLLVTGFLPGVAGLLLVWGVWAGRKWAWRWVQIFFALLVFYYWLDFLLLSASQTAKERWPFFFGLTLVLTFWIGWVLSRPAVHRFFGVSDNLEN